MSPEGIVTTKQAAAILSITTRGVAYLCKSGALKCERVGNIYLIEEQSVRDYATNRPKPGPRPGSKRKPKQENNSL